MPNDDRKPSAEAPVRSVEGGPSVVPFKPSKIHAAGMRSRWATALLGMALAGSVLAERADRDRPVHLDGGPVGLQVNGPPYRMPTNLPPSPAT